MIPPIIVASHDLREGAAIAAALAPQFQARAVTESPALLDAVESVAAVVLDTNFTDAQAIDVLMEVMSRTQVPVVMLTPEGDPTCVTEAIRCGAAGFLVKTGAYVDLLPTALQEAMQKAEAAVNLKRELAELRRRNAKLEKEVKSVRLKTMLRIPAAEGLAAVKASEPEAAMEEIIAERIKSGTLQLPSYPKIAVKLRELLEQDVGIVEVAQLLSQDAAVSAKLLRVANSAQYSNLRHVDSVEGAVSRVGLAKACNVAEMVANRSLYASRNAAYRGLLEDLWIHSLAVAHASTFIARHVGKSGVRHMFSLGLLHDSGRLALMQAVAQADPQGKHIEGEDNLKKFFGFLRKHNVSCGVALVKHWGFDQEFLDAVRYNYDLSGADKPTRSLMIVNLANTLARAIGYGNALDNPDELEKSPANGFLFPGDSDLEPIIGEVHHAIEQTKQMLA